MNSVAAAIIGISLSSLSRILQRVSNGSAEEECQLPWIFIKVVVDDNVELVTGFDGVTGPAAAHGRQMARYGGTVPTSHACRVTHCVACSGIAQEFVVLVDRGIDASVVQVPAL